MSKPAEVFPLRSFILDEMAERGWSAEELCRRTAVPSARVMAFLGDDEVRLSLHEAEQLAYTFNVSPLTLLNIQMGYEAARKLTEE